MTNNEFDTSLQKIASEEVLPFDERNWELLKARLDEKPNRKALLLLFPFSIKQWAAAACLTLGLGAGIWHFSTNKTNGPVVTSTEKKQTPSFIPSPAATVQDTNNSITNIPAVTDKQNIQHSPTPLYKSSIATADTTVPNSAPPIPTLENANNTALNSVPKLNNKQQKEPLPFNDYYEPKTDKSVSLSINGGLAFQNSNNIAAGVTIRNRVSRTISIETNLRYVQGQQSIPFKNEKITEVPRVVLTDTGSMMEIDRQVETWYEQHNRSTPYLQLNPAVNIKLHKKINSSIGLDVQKILVANSTLASWNEKLAIESKKIPEVDPGVVLNINYSLTKRIGCGVAYRESMLNLGGGNMKYINRDYFMIQLQYAIIK